MLDHSDHPEKHSAKKGKKVSEAGSPKHRHVNLSKTPAAEKSVATAADPQADITALARNNRILQKQLDRSERTRAQMEADNQRREHMLRQLLKEAEAYSAELSAAKQELTQLNQQLENRIEQRSAALNDATDSLQAAQRQVANSEKFSTLGELVAGVAHEINNPIGCITNNLKFVAEYTENLLEHVALQQTVITAARNKVQSTDLEKVENHAENIELEYIAEDFQKLIDSMTTSGDRITAISQSLRTFARADVAQKQSYDLHEGLNGTLLILRHRLKAAGKRPTITVDKSYGNIEPIHCYPGQINQVFMNIIANAIDAMEEKDHFTEPPAIKIATTSESGNITVYITDNAGGISKDIQDKIFENQFTTKATGKGTGLGLAIAHQIVTEVHRGTIECLSTPGVGTTFRIILPRQVPTTKQQPPKSSVA
ncbi:MAG: ATP-binding protein [Cyanobacteria bacterium J06623_4]